MTPQPHVSIFDPTAAGIAADTAVSELISADNWKPPFVGAVRGTPLLVRRLDREDDYYFIVPYSKHGITTGRLVIEARTKRVEEIGAIENSGEALVEYSNPSTVLDQLAVREPSPTWLRFQIRREATCQVPPLGWKSCIESRSKLRPFYLLTVGDQLVYMRTDGEIFPSLRVGPDA